MRLLIFAALAIAAIAAPAAAQAEGPFWHVNGEKLEEEELEVAVDGPLSFRIGPSIVITCSELAFDGTIRNGEEKAEGEIDSLVEAPCSTNIPGCAVESLSAQKVPWTMAVISTTNIDWEDIEFEADLSPGCSVLFPPTISWAGTLEGGWVNEAGCFQYWNAGWLTLTGPGWWMPVNGELCLSTEKGPVTLA